MNLSNIRTFIAIEIPAAVRKRISEVQNEFQKENERISWTKPENIHVTLKFLGDVEENKIDAIASVVQKTAKNIQSFNVKVKNLGAFPNLRRARVLWVGLENATAELTQIAEGMETGLSQLGFPEEERKFSPHLTIGRVKSALSTRFVEKFQNYAFEGGEFQVEEIVVMKSDLRPSGAIYTPLRKVRLKENNGVNKSRNI
jgi:2'-5' RNA ligase